MKIIKFLKVSLLVPKYLQTSARLMQPSKLLSKSQATNAKNIQTGEKNPDLKLKQWQTFHIVLKNGFLLLELILLEFIHHLLPLSTFFFFLY